MASKKRKGSEKTTKRKPPAAAETPSLAREIPPQLREFLNDTAIPKGFNSKRFTLPDLRKRLTELDVRPTVGLKQLLPALTGPSTGTSRIPRLRRFAAPLGMTPNDTSFAEPNESGCLPGTRCRLLFA